MATNQALKDVLKSLEKHILNRVDAEVEAKKLIESVSVKEIADLIQENQRLKSVKKEYTHLMKYTMACKKLISRHCLTQELINDTACL
jgi:hypothetical protein